MKRTIIFLAVIVISASCKKEVDVDPEAQKSKVTITQSPTFASQSITPPGTSVKLLEQVIDIRNCEGFYMPYINIGLIVSDGLQLNQITNLKIVYKSKNEVIISETISSTAYQYIPYDIKLQRPTSTIDTVQIFADIPSSSTRGKVVTDIFYRYRWRDTGYITQTVFGQTTTFVATALLTSLSASTAPSGPVLSHAPFSALSVDLSAVGQAIKPKVATIIVDGTYIQEARFYVDSTVLVGSTTFPTTGIATKVVPLTMQAIPAGGMKKLRIEYTPKVMTNGPSFQPTLKTGLKSITYEGADGIARINDTMQVGNDLYLLNSLVVLNEENLSGSLINGSPMILKKWSVRSAGGNAAVKQMTLSVNQFDLGASNSLRIAVPKLKANGVVMNNVIFINQSGQILDSIKPTDTKVYIVAVSGAGQFLPITTTATTYELEGEFRGYTDGVDYAKIEILTDPIPVSGNYRYLNTGTAPLSAATYMSLYSSPNPSAQATPAHFIWTDKADGPANSGAPGSGSNAWHNGYWVFKNYTSAPQFWYQ